MMNRYEKERIERLPDEFRPIGAWGYFGYTILFSIPVLGTIFLIIFALSGSNVNRRSFARSFFCGIIIAIIAIVVGLIILLAMSGAFKGGFNLSSIIETLKQMVMQYVELIKSYIPAGK